MDQKEEDLIKMTLGSKNAQAALARTAFVAKMFAKAAEATSRINDRESQWLRSVADFLEDGLEPIRIDLTACGFQFQFPLGELQKEFDLCLGGSGLWIEQLKIPRDPDKEAVFRAKFRP
jgi:hypothetical protein